jgi:hypothetical protein
MNTPRPVLIALSILAGLDVIVAGAAFQEVIGLQAAGLTVLAMAAIKVGVAFYLQGQVVPLSSTVAYVRDNSVQAGGAATQQTGTPIAGTARVESLVSEEMLES